MCEFSDASFGEVADVGSEVADSVSDIGEGLDSIEELSEFTDFGSDTFESIDEADDLTGLDDAAIDECALEAEAADADFSEFVDIDEGSEPVSVVDEDISLEEQSEYYGEELPEISADGEEGMTEAFEEQSDAGDIADEIDSDESESLEDESAPTLSEVMDDPEFFEKHEAGDYQYGQSDIGKSAYGVLDLADDPVRDSNAQREAGGLERRQDDDGGHLIGARFGGSPTDENLDAQNRNLNRGAYKREENAWAEGLQEGDKIFVNTETYKREGTERPDAYMGWTVTESPDGQRHWDAFSYTNESTETQDQWAKELEEMPDTDYVPNAMVDGDYENIHDYIDELEGNE